MIENCYTIADKKKQKTQKMDPTKAMFKAGA